MAALRRLLLVAGRYRAENPYLELAVKRQLEAAGVAVTLALPTRSLNKAGFPDSLRDDPVLRAEGAVWIDDDWAFSTRMRNCQAVLFSTWKGYEPLARMARNEGRLTLDFSAIIGLDHLPVGFDHSLVKSEMTRRFLLNGHRVYGWRRISPERITVTGSILYEDPEHLGAIDGMDDRETFCRAYGLDPARPIAVLFPKAVIGFHKKARLWFPDWSQEQVDRYNQQVLDAYIAICAAVHAADCNLLVKLHPSSYAAYWCRTEEEYDYWNRYPWIRILRTEHTHAMFRHADVGLGINSHAAMDMAYFSKPFIYVDSDRLPPPQAPGFNLADHRCTLPRGPSSHWHTTPLETVNPWFASWVGWFARVETLPQLLRDPATYRVDPEALQTFNREFWFRNDGQASRRVVEFVLAFADRELNGWRLRCSPRRWWGALWDLYYRHWRDRRTTADP